MAVVSLPLSFNNSFWTQDYRTGLEILIRKLEQGVVENDEIIAFIRARAVAEANLAAALKNIQPARNATTGFYADDGASLLMAFRGLQNESREQGKAHEDVSKDLHARVADPFQQWAKAHEDRLRKTKNTALEGWLSLYESFQQEVQKSKEQYVNKLRRADEAEDDARLVSKEFGDKLADSPSLGPRDLRTGSPRPKRQPTVSERIAQRLMDFGQSAMSNGTGSAPAQPEQVFDAGSEKSPSPNPEKGKAKATEQDLIASPSSLSPSLPPSLSIIAPDPPAPVLLAGLPFAPETIVKFLTQAKSQLPLRAVRFSILGEYQDCFSGEDFVTWLRENVPAFERNLDISVAAARNLTEREDLLRRIGEFGNSFENSKDAYYQLRPKAFTFGQAIAQGGKSPLEAVSSPIAENLVKTSSSLVNIVSKALNGPTEPPFVRLRREADIADGEYRDAVRKLDRQRLGLEERIEEVLKAFQKWESERLRTIKSVLLKYQESISALPKTYDTSVEQCSTFVSSFNAESDLNALIERYRTGPFRPGAHVYDSVLHDEPGVVFGIDLRRWSEGVWGAVNIGEEKKDQIPPVLSTLLTAIGDRYSKLSDDAEKRKTWIYEVPLIGVHHLRESLNAVPLGQDIPEDLLIKYDAPVLAGTVKLWMLELDPPLGMYEGWDEIRKIYPTVGASTRNQDIPEEQHFEAVQSALQRMPKVHLFVIDAIICHFKELIASTKTEESDEVYLTKLALSVGRAILRPKQENEKSVQDRHPTLFLMDLVNHYDQLLPPALEKKKRELERKVPTRKRTAIVDMRMRRSQLSDTSDLKEIIVAQHRAMSPSSVTRSPPASRSSFSSTASPLVSNPEQIKIQAPVAVHGQTHGVPAALREGVSSPSLGTLVAPPPPPSIVAVPSPLPLMVDEKYDLPPMPQFKEPPPDIDGLSPRPTFKEPPSEFEDESPLKSVVSPNQTPPSPSASPAPGKVTRATPVRGPRTTRGPRVAHNSSLTRRDFAHANSPTSPNNSAFGAKNSPANVKRRSGSGSSFSRRTMASDAEVR